MKHTSYQEHIHILNQRLAQDAQRMDSITLDIAAINQAKLAACIKTYAKKLAQRCRTPQSDNTT